MLGVAAPRIVHPIRKPRNNADECHCAETRRDGAFRAICFVAPLARGACHGRRVASRISSRKASVAATRDLFRGSLGGTIMFARFQRSWDLAAACMRLLLEDKSLLVFPLLSSIAVVLVVGSFAVPL